MIPPHPAREQFNAEYIAMRKNFLYNKDSNVYDAKLWVRQHADKVVEQMVKEQTEKVAKRYYSHNQRDAVCLKKLFGNSGEKDE